MRRIVCVSAPRLAVTFAARTAVSDAVRSDISRVATKVKDEANGQALDIAEMAESTRTALKSVQDALARHPDGAGDAKVKGKLTTLSASLKAYQNRLTNVQNEAKSIHREAETLVKHLWGNETVTVETETVEAAKVAEAAEDFSAEAPPIARALGNDRVENVEAERVKDHVKSSGSPQPEEVEVEVLEVEVESPVEDIPVTTITQELYERGIDFADCKDAKSLRKRYADVKAGKFDRQPEPPQKTQQTRPAPPPPRPSQQQQQSYNSGYNSSSTTNETGLAFDPHPGAMRKMIDPMKAVWEVKQELARENGVDANNIDLWSGSLKLEDHKRLHEYGTAIQSNPIEVRNKGDIPQYRS